MKLLTKNIGKEFQVCRRKRKKYSKCMLGCFMFCSFSCVISVGYVVSYGDLARMQIFFLASLYHLLSGQISRDKHLLASPSQSFWLKILKVICLFFFNISWDFCALLLFWKSLPQNPFCSFFYLSVIPQADSGICQEYYWS